MRVTASDRAVFQGVGGWQILIALTPEQAADLDKIKDKDIDLTVHHEMRSLNANSYFHVLCRELAHKLDSSEEEIKVLMVVRYGSYLRGSDGKIVGASVPFGSDITSIHPYWKACGDPYERNGKQYQDWLALKRTSDLDTSEMSKLITGVCSECKDMGIETMPPIELKELMNSWESAKSARSEERSTSTT